MSGREKASPHVNADFDPRIPLHRNRALTPHVMRLNEQRVARGFWPKIRKVAAHVPFASDALAVWFCARDDETPVAAKGMMFAALTRSPTSSPASATPTMRRCLWPCCRSSAST